MKKALIVVEGEVEEVEFFNSMRLSLGLDFETYAIGSNIYNLFRQMEKENFEIDVRHLLLDIEPKPTEEEKIKILDDYDFLFFIYDIDIQDSPREEMMAPLPISQRAKRNFEKLKKMIEELRDEEDLTRGLLLLNYPMIESYRDADSFFDNGFKNNSVSLSLLNQNDGYKKLVKHRLLSRYNHQNWTRENFYDLMRMHAFKMNFVLKKRWRMPSPKMLMTENYNQLLVEAQFKKSLKDASVFTLNTSLLFPLYRYGTNFSDYPQIKSVAKTALVSIILEISSQDTIMDLQLTLDSLICQDMPSWNLFVLFRDQVRDDILTHLEQFPFFKDVLQVDDFSQGNSVKQDFAKYFIFVRLGSQLLPRRLTAIKGLSECYTSALAFVFNGVCSNPEETTINWVNVIKSVSYNSHDNMKKSFLQRIKNLNINKLVFKNTLLIDRLIFEPQDWLKRIIESNSNEDVIDLSLAVIKS